MYYCKWNKNIISCQKEIKIQSQIRIYESVTVWGMDPHKEQSGLITPLRAKVLLLLVATQRVKPLQSVTHYSVSLSIIFISLLFTEDVQSINRWAYICAYLCAYTQNTHIYLQLLSKEVIISSQKSNLCIILSLHYLIIISHWAVVEQQSSTAEEDKDKLSKGKTSTCSFKQLWKTSALPACHKKA